MRVRGTTQNFYVALPIAFFSGLGVAVSLLDEQTSSLVGVAISASLLPPAVNAGILWIAFAFAKTSVITSSCNTPELEFNASDVLNTTDTNATEFGDGGRELVLHDTTDDHFLLNDVVACNDPASSQNMHADQFYRAGAVSLTLTVANILLIWIR